MWVGETEYDNRPMGTCGVCRFIAHNIKQKYEEVNLLRRFVYPSFDYVSRLSTSTSVNMGYILAIS